MDNPWNNDYTKQAHHLHKILERVQRQQRQEMNHQEAAEHQAIASSPSETENEAKCTSSEPNRADLHVNNNSNPQDQVLDYSTKGTSRPNSSRLQEVPTFQTSIFSGEFRNSAELQNFERLLEIRSAKRRGTLKFEIIQYLRTSYRLCLDIKIS